jgi:cytochrome c oxidase subunit II
VNQYGIPGFIKDAWFKATTPGTYKGQCSQICGKLHGYMPITVEVKSEADYAKWVKDSQAKWSKPLTAAAPAVAAPAAAEADANKKFTLAEAKELGEKVYAGNCAACHQATGKGMPPTFPALSGSKLVMGPVDAQVNILLNGKPGTAMQSFARLTDTELAAVITYTKNSWDNNTGKIVQPADVKSARKS